MLAVGKGKIIVLLDDSLPVNIVLQCLVSVISRSARGYETNFASYAYLRPFSMRPLAICEAMDVVSLVGH
jgi:hypothetical protein